MNAQGLTGPKPAATTRRMGEASWRRERSTRRAWGPAVLAMAVAMMMSGCISVTAPDKPIVIELNINIKQEVVYRLAADAENTIQENAGIF
ncbi:MAG: YnbE family lipoprotein [Novosphingobium sp.]|nr:YnbE family lipoprotein [Novosphingobium sp.]